VYLKSVNAQSEKATAESRETRHPTKKPVSIMAWSIEQTKSNGAIIDPFLGSGTTLVAAEQLGRKCYGMEISPAYCDVIVKRWENLTGKKAVLETSQQEGGNG
jgi:DNA modification methylase